MHRDKAGFSGTKRDSAGRSGIRRDEAGFGGTKWDSVRQGGIQRDKVGFGETKWDSAGRSEISAGRAAAFPTGRNSDGADRERQARSRRPATLTASAWLGGISRALHGASLARPPCAVYRTMVWGTHLYAPLRRIVITTKWGSCRLLWFDAQCAADSDQVAGGLVAGRDLPHRRLLDAATLLGHGAAGVPTATPASSPMPTATTPT